MTEIAAYRTMIEAASRDLRAATSDLDSEQFTRRPAPGANSVGFIYFHVLRHWDRDVNVLCRGLDQAADRWHSAGLSAECGYEPLGKGAWGIGTGYGYTAEQVDDVPLNQALLSRYHDLLEADTREFLDAVDVSTLDVERTAPTGITFTIAGRLRHLIAHTYLHCGDIEYAKGLVGAKSGDIPSVR